MMFRKKVWVTTIALVMSVFQISSSALTSGYVGVSTYSDWWNDDCSFGDRAGASYVSNLQSAISSKFTQQYSYTNSNANENRIKNSSTVNFFAFSGHGLSGSTENYAHTYARSTGESWHNSSMEWDNTVNASTNELRFAHDYVTMYSCNQLTNGGSSTKQTNIWNMFVGMRIQMGFASTMYLDSREGTLYGNYINQGACIKDAFLDAARYYQPQRTSGDSIARTEGYTAAKNDSATSRISGPIPNYSNSPNSFSVFDTITIPHNGNPI